MPNVYGAVITATATARVHPVHLINIARAPGSRRPLNQANHHKPQIHLRAPVVFRFTTEIES